MDWISSKTDSELLNKYKLSYHVPYARMAEKIVGLRNQRVLEVGGSLPSEFVLKDIGAKSWISIESMQYWDETFSTGFKSGTPPEKDQINILTDESYIGQQSYGILYENIEKLPPNFYEKFERVFSIAAFEHILRLPAALERMYDALEPDGLLFALFAPVWSAHDGHYLPKISDGQGGVFDFSNSPIPPWGHLLMSPSEMIRTIEPVVGRDVAQEIAYFVYKSPHISRNFTEDYEEIISNSRFRQERFEPVYRIAIAKDILARLKSLYPHHQHFDNNGILIVLSKDTKHAGDRRITSKVSSESDSRTDVNSIRRFIDKGEIKEAASAIKEAIRNNVNLENMNVNFAHILLLSGDWHEISGLLPKDSNFFHTSGWLNSVRHNRPISGDDKPIPWFTYPAIDFLDDIVKNNWSVFEWGSGNSTLWWASKVEKVIAIEDNQAWFMEVKNKLPQNSEIFYKTGSEYFDSILMYPDCSFDAIIIDGSFRTEAAKNCIRKIKDQGIIIFDNSDAMDHEPAQKYLTSQDFYRIDFWGLIPSYLYKNCTSVYFRDINILKQINPPTTHISSVGISCQQSIDRITGKVRLYKDEVKVCSVNQLKESAKGNGFEQIKVILEGSCLPLKHLNNHAVIAQSEGNKIKTELSEKNKEETNKKLAVAFSIIEQNRYDQFKEALSTIQPEIHQLQNNFNACVAVAYAAWVTNDTELCRWASKQCIQLNPDSSLGYIRLGLLELGNQQYMEADSVLSAGKLRCPADGQIKVWHNLAEHLVKGTHTVKFNFDGLEYIFGLSVFNTQAMEAAVNHLMGTLTEPDELRIVQKFVGQCDTVVEVGALVGNHTMFFAKTLLPKKIYVFDANSVAVEYINQTISLNGIDASRIKIIVRHAAVSAKAGNMLFFNEDVEVVCLDDEVKDKVDFIKIDVDGMEMEVLEGCRSIISRDRPKMMIEVKKRFENQFYTLVEQHKYTIIDKIVRQADTNFFVGPLEKIITALPRTVIGADKKYEYPNIKTLIFFLSQRQAYRPILFSTNEVFCGPDCEMISTDGLYSTIKTPAGMYDVKAVVEQLPLCQIPEIVVVKADATRRNFPINLNSFKCPKILIIGNTQHLVAPVRTLLQYAYNERFDFIMTDHKRHHLHFFKEAGFERVFWLPGVNVYPHEQSLFENKLYDVSFVGQVGRWHPYRKTVLQFLQANDIPVQIMQAPHEKAAEIYAKSLINLNISLNGDFNLRVFEVLSSGGFLLTDRLGRESGLEMIFKDGEHLVCYDSQQDLLEKIRYYLKHPSEANAIAQKGYEEYKRHHTPETKTNELIDFILNGRLNPLYEIQKDSRSIHVRSKSKEDLFQRISTYEYLQDVHLKNHEPAALFFPSVDPRLLCDVSDLPRLRLYIKGIGTDIPDTSLQLFNDTNIADRIHSLSLEELKKIQGAWDIVVLTASDIVDQNLEDFLISLNFKLLVVSDSLSSIDEDSRAKLLEYLSTNGLEKIHENPDVFFWKDKSLWGEYLFSKGLTAEAVRNFERALADNPANENALNNLGVISYQLNRYEAAEKFMLKAVSLNRRNINSLNNLVQLYMTRERFEDAAGLLLEITGMNPEQPEPWYLLGLCQERLNQLDSAFDAFKKAEKFDGSAYPMPEGMHAQLDKSMFEKNNSQSRIPPEKILVINNLYPPQEMGGYGRLLFDFTNILRNRGHSIYVLTSDSPYLGKTDGDKHDVHRRLVLFGGWDGGVCKTMENRDDIIQIVRKNIAGLEQVLKEFRPDACLLGNIDFLSRNIMNPMLDKKIPIIHHMGNQQPGYAVNETPKNRLYHLAAASNWLKKEIQKQGYPLKDISVVFPGALVEEFRMRIPPALDKLRIVYASIVLPYKGPHILINALKKLHDSGIDFSCSIAGSSTDKNFVDSLKSFVAGNGMEDRIHFLGFLPRDELKNLFARHNVLVFPSLFQEPFGISQVEAMAAGLTVVTSGTGGAKEIVEHGVSGIIFKTEDDASLAEELIQLAKYPLKCQQIALAGQRRAIEKFDIERSVDALESCFARLLQTKGIR